METGDCNAYDFLDSGMPQIEFMSQFLVLVLKGSNVNNDCVFNYPYSLPFSFGFEYQETECNGFHVWLAEHMRDKDGLTQIVWDIQTSSQSTQNEVLIQATIMNELHRSMSGSNNLSGYEDNVTREAQLLFEKSMGPTSVTSVLMLVVAKQGKRITKAWSIPNYKALKIMIYELYIRTIKSAHPKSIMEEYPSIIRYIFMWWEGAQDILKSMPSKTQIHPKTTQVLHITNYECGLNPLDFSHKPLASSSFTSHICRDTKYDVFKSSSLETSHKVSKMVWMIIESVMFGPSPSVTHVLNENTHRKNIMEWNSAIDIHDLFGRIDRSSSSMIENPSQYSLTHHHRFLPPFFNLVTVYIILYHKLREKMGSRWETELSQSSSLTDSDSTPSLFQSSTTIPKKRNMTQSYFPGYLVETGEYNIIHGEVSARKLEQEPRDQNDATVPDSYLSYTTRLHGLVDVVLFILNIIMHTSMSKAGDYEKFLQTKDVSCLDSIIETYCASSSLVYMSDEDADHMLSQHFLEYTKSIIRESFLNYSKLQNVKFTNVTNKLMKIDCYTNYSLDGAQDEHACARIRFPLKFLNPKTRLSMHEITQLKASHESKEMSMTEASTCYIHMQYLLPILEKHSFALSPFGLVERTLLDQYHQTEDNLEKDQICSMLGFVPSTSIHTQPGLMIPRHIAQVMEALLQDASIESMETPSYLLDMNASIDLYIDTRNMTNSSMCIFNLVQWITHAYPFVPRDVAQTCLAMSHQQQDVIGLRLPVPIYHNISLYMIPWMHTLQLDTSLSFVSMAPFHTRNYYLALQTSNCAGMLCVGEALNHLCGGCLQPKVLLQSRKRMLTKEIEMSYMVHMSFLPVILRIVGIESIVKQVAETFNDPANIWFEYSSAKSKKKVIKGLKGSTQCFFSAMRAFLNPCESIVVEKEAIDKLYGRMQQSFVHKFPSLAYFLLVMFNRAMSGDPNNELRIRSNKQPHNGMCSTIRFIRVPKFIPFSDTTSASIASVNNMKWKKLLNLWKQQPQSNPSMDKMGQDVREHLHTTANKHYAFTSINGSESLSTWSSSSSMDISSQESDVPFIVYYYMCALLLSESASELMEFFMCVKLTNECDMDYIPVCHTTSPAYLRNHPNPTCSSSEELMHCESTTEEDPPSFASTLDASMLFQTFSMLELLRTLKFNTTMYNDMLSKKKTSGIQSHDRPHEMYAGMLSMDMLDHHMHKEFAGMSLSQMFKHARMPTNAFCDALFYRTLENAHKITCNTSNKDHHPAFHHDFQYTTKLFETTKNIHIHNLPDTIDKTDYTSEYYYRSVTPSYATLFPIINHVSPNKSPKDNQQERTCNNNSTFDFVATFAPISEINLATLPTHYDQLDAEWVHGCTYTRFKSK